MNGPSDVNPQPYRHTHQEVQAWTERILTDLNHSNKSLCCQGGATAASRPKRGTKKENEGSFFLTTVALVLALGGIPQVESWISKN